MCVLSIKVSIRKKSGNIFNDPRISVSIPLPSLAYLFFFLLFFFLFFFCSSALSHLFSSTPFLSHTLSPTSSSTLSSHPFLSHCYSFLLPPRSAVLLIFFTAPPDQVDNEFVVNESKFSPRFYGTNDLVKGVRPIISHNYRIK